MPDIPWQWQAAVFIAGLVLGSFLNVVIVRLPKMLARRDAGRGADGGDEDDGEDALSLASPASHCPACRRPLKAWHNIPLLSYLALRGRCAWCRAPISPRYPVVELATALALVGVLAVHQAPPAFAAGAALSACLIALVAIDLRDGLLPDAITLPLLWLGLAVNSFGLFTDAASAVLGAIAGYLSFAAMNQCYAAVRKQQGLGGGDMKLLAALGAWFGWQALPGIVLLASVTGLATSLAMIAAGRWKRTTRIPFGPYLALAGWVCLLFGETLRDPLRVLLGGGEWP
ncbi:MAG: A24 family peptidase [Gammaproteobacteria bacterium]|nr:A24 family peptidase [Gammaproteobacteria bacterium]